DFTVHIRHFPRGCLDEALVEDLFRQLFQVEVHEAVLVPNLDHVHELHKEVKEVLARLQRVKLWNSLHHPRRHTSHASWKDLLQCRERRDTEEQLEEKKVSDVCCGRCVLTLGRSVFGRCCR